ncbi:MAG: alpha/beta fold hydrolase [Rhodospirillum sp.]|nr:alpha/beta fold hydrolase [Rhodospirillum sp.]MCF8489282.1 alpha/beta fold hydrolase [Rhodospirillum sp.]MCF8502003.1 alpha/beta fold hydrolase [Rhodospirillum sp.]
MLLNTGSGRFDLVLPSGHAVGQIPVWYHLPDGLDADGRIVIVLHGTSRAARASRDNWSVQATKHGFCVVVPEFELRHFPDPDYAYGNLWTPDPPHRRKSWSESHGAILDTLFDVATEALGGQRRQLVLYGHSAGAAFAHRYMTFAPVDRVSHAIFANAGWYSLMDLDRPIPFGLQGGDASLERLRIFLEKPVTVLVGDRDRAGPYPAWWPVRTADQGPHRVARGETYFASARRMAEQLGAAFGWRWQTVPDVAHENAKMIEPAARLLAETRIAE